MNTINICIVEDHELIRSSLSYMLRAELQEIGNIYEASEFSDIQPLFDKPIDFYLIDIKLKTLNGFEIAVLIHQVVKDTKIIFITAFPTDSYIQKAIRVGASAFLSKSSSMPELMKCIRELRYKTMFFNDLLTESKWLNLWKRSTQSEKPVDLQLDPSIREKIYLKYLSQGIKQHEIAILMGITTETVKTMRKRILKKLDLKDQHELFIFASEYIGKD